MANCDRFDRIRCTICAPGFDGASDSGCNNNARCAAFTSVGTSAFSSTGSPNSTSTNFVVASINAFAPEIATPGSVSVEAAILDQPLERRIAVDEVRSVWSARSERPTLRSRVSPSSAPTCAAAIACPFINASKRKHDDAVRSGKNLHRAEGLGELRAGTGFTGRRLTRILGVPRERGPPLERPWNPRERRSDLFSAAAWGFESLPPTDTALHGST